MSVEEWHMVGWACLALLWCAWTFCSWVSDNEFVWGLWAVAHVLGLLALGVYGVTR